jgi:hypothetical protein
MLFWLLKRNKLYYESSAVTSFDWHVQRGRRHYRKHVGFWVGVIER